MSQNQREKLFILCSRIHPLSLSVKFLNGAPKSVKHAIFYGYFGHQRIQHVTSQTRIH